MLLDHDFRHGPRDGHIGYISRVGTPSLSKVANAMVAVAGATPAVVAMLDGTLAGWPALGWSLSAMLFAATFSSTPPPHPAVAPDSISALRAVIMTSTATLMVAFSEEFARYASSIAFVLLVQKLPACVSPRAGVLLIALQSAILLGIFWLSDGWMAGLSASGVLLGVQYFALGRSTLMMREQRARDELEAINQELRATRQLLEERSRADERLRIARDLHDTLGHHLTAMSIQLEVASRLTFTNESGYPTVHVNAEAARRVENQEHAAALYRCVQEIVTNTTRHAGARNIWIDITESNGGIGLHARDDGRGAEAPIAGYGLSGMKERFERLSGCIEFETSPGKGRVARTADGRH